MRKFFVLALAALLVLSLSSFAHAQDQITLRLAGWSSSPAEDAALQSRLDAFTAANPNIKVDFQPSTDHTTTMQTAFASGDYAEVFYVDSSLFNAWADAGVIADGSDKIEDPEDIYQPLRDLFTKNGKLYCPPKDFSILGLEYNKDMFDKAGVATPTADWKWDDLKAAAEKLTGTTADGKKIVGLILPADLNRWLPFIYQNGGMLFDKDGKYAFNSDATTGAISYFLDMVTAGNAAPASAVDAGWGGEALWKGRAAMAMEGNWVIQPMLDNAPDLNWGVSELPQGPNGGKATMVYSVCYGVNAKSNKHADESWKLVNFLTGKDGEMAVATSGFGVLPTRTSSADAWVQTWTKKLTDMKKEDLAKELGAFQAGAAYGVPWILPTGWNTFNDTFNASLQEAFNGNKLAEDVVKDATDVATELETKGAMTPTPSS